MATAARWSCEPSISASASRMRRSLWPSSGVSAAGEVYALRVNRPSSRHTPRSVETVTESMRARRRTGDRRLVLETVSRSGQDAGASGSPAMPSSAPGSSSW